MRERNGLFSKVWNMPYGYTNQFHLFDAAKNSKYFIQKLRLERKIPVHNGCVNSIVWNSDGKYLLSGSDDQRLAIVNGYDYTVLAYILTGHRANIFSAKFLPNTGDSHIVSCSGDGIIIYSDVEWPETSMHNKFNCHLGTAYEVMTVPNDPNTFLTCGEDKTVRWFDLRTKNSCTKEDCKEDVLINCRSPVTSLAVNPVTPYQLAVGCADASVRIFDRRMLGTRATGSYLNDDLQALMTCFTVPEFTHSRRITSLCYSPDGKEMLVSYSSDYIYLFDIRDNLEKTPRVLSSKSDAANFVNRRLPIFKSRPSMKRLRVRGDWSDTGPDARPEAESRSEQQSSPQGNLVRRMTDILTRMLNTARNRNQSSTSQSSSTSSHVSSQSEEGEMDVTSDANEEDENVTGDRASKTEMAKTEKNLSKAGPSNESKCKKRSSEGNNKSSSSSASSAFAAGDTDSQSISNTADASQETPQCESLDASLHESSKEILPCEAINHVVQENIQDTSESCSDITEKHHSEPENLDNSSQSASSAQVTMDIPSSNTTCIEAESTNEPVENIAEEPSVNNPLMESSTSGSETEAAIQSIEPNVSAASNEQCNRVPTLLTPEAEVLPGEVALMMEVDSWDVDSDDETPSSPQASGRTRRSSCDRLPDSFFCSLDDDDAAREEVRMVNVPKPRVKTKYTGHRNARTMIKESTFWGDNFIMSGSDCGHIFIWDRMTAELIMIMEADHHVVNCLQPHPFDPILASSGIDYDIKLWAPLREEPFFDIEKATEMIKRNQIMLEETKDTITVPASFMFRMFATLNHFRSGHAWSRTLQQIRNSGSDSNSRS